MAIDASAGPLRNFDYRSFQGNFNQHTLRPYYTGVEILICLSELDTRRARVVCRTWRSLRTGSEAERDYDLAQRADEEIAFYFAHGIPPFEHWGSPGRDSDG